MTETPEVTVRDVPASYLERHPELQDVVPTGERHRFGLA